MLYRLGDNLHHLGRHEEEEKAYQEALDFGTNYIVFYRITYNLAVCALSQGNETKASANIEKYRSIRKEKGVGPYDIELDIAKIYQEAGLPDRAIEILKGLIAAYPRGSVALGRLGYIQIKDKNYIDEGLDLVNQALELDPNNTDFLYTKGLGYHKKGKTEEAYEILKRGWDIRLRYDYEHFKLLKEVEQALASQNQ